MRDFSRIEAEFLGTAGLLIVVVGSGIMGETLAPGNSAMALLANSLATGAGLFALIQIFAPISGAHFNPLVSWVEWRRGNLNSRNFGFYVGAQILGALVGVVLTHLMFKQDLIQISTQGRGDWQLLVSEVMATIGLILIICLAAKPQVPLSISLFITSAYWSTSSTSFANPAVTLARSFTNTFSGINWLGVPGFWMAQFLGAFLAYRWACRVSKNRTRHVT